MDDGCVFRSAVRYLSGDSPFHRPVAVVPCCAPDPSNPSGCTAPWHADRKNHKIAKTPVVAWAPFQTRLPTGAEWRDWWRRWAGRCNIGCVTGAASGALLLDVDRHAAEADGRRTLEERGLFVPATPAARSPNDGLHVWFSYPSEAEPGSLRNFQSRPDWPGLDARADGGFAVLPPSLGVNGRQYEWLAEARDLPLAVAPGWFLAQFGAHSRRTGPAVPLLEDEWARLWRGPWAPGSRHGAAGRLIGHWIAFGIAEPEAEAMLLSWNQTACTPPKGDAAIVAHVRDMFKRYNEMADADDAAAEVRRLPANVRRDLRNGNPGQRFGAAVEALRLGCSEAGLRVVLAHVGEADPGGCVRRARRVAVRPGQVR